MGERLLRIWQSGLIGAKVRVAGQAWQHGRDGMISDMFYSAIESEMSRMSSFHSNCTANSLPALPRLSTESVFGYCFACGIGLSDKIDFNFIPRCSCLGGGDDGDDICLCSGCIEDFSD